MIGTKYSFYKIRLTSANLIKIHCVIYAVMNINILTIDDN